MHWLELKTRECSNLEVGGCSRGFMAGYFYRFLQGSTMSRLLLRGSPHVLLAETIVVSDWALVSPRWANICKAHSNIYNTARRGTKACASI